MAVSDNLGICYICKSEADHFECPRCGKFEPNDIAIKKLTEKQTLNEIAKISLWPLLMESTASISTEKNQIDWSDHEELLYEVTKNG